MRKPGREEDRKRGNEGRINNKGTKAQSDSTIQQFNDSTILSFVSLLFNSVFDVRPPTHRLTDLLPHP